VYLYSLAFPVALCTYRESVKYERLFRYSVMCFAYDVSRVRTNGTMCRPRRVDRALIYSGLAVIECAFAMTDLRVSQTMQRWRKIKKEEEEEEEEE